MSLKDLYRTAFVLLFGFIHCVHSQTNSTDDDVMLDLIFILDSSGSVYDNGYDNWQAEIDFVKAVVNHSLPTNARVGLINFSGCGSNKDFDDCRANGKLKKMWGLNDFGTPNDHDAVYNRISQITYLDFNGGYTWTDQALYLALTEFQGNSSAEHAKMIILLTDGTISVFVHHSPTVIVYSFLLNVQR